MAKLTFQENFFQWENWEKVDFTPDIGDGDFVRFKIGDAKRQIKVKMHKRELEMFVNKLDSSNTSDSVDPIVDFALKIAKALKESQSSTALFFVQQAYPDDIDGLEQQNSDEILDNIITIASEWLKPRPA